MKKLLLLGSACCLSFLTKAAVIYWDGEAGDGRWSTAGNWSGNTVPGAADEVVLDNSILTGSYTVELPVGPVTISVASVTITPLLPNNIMLVLPNTNTANPGLQVTGAGDALVLNNGAVLQNSSGATTGTGLTIVHAFRINNGGHYIHNTARGNALIMDRLSSVAGTESGIVEFRVPGGAAYTPSLQGRIFGTLILSLNPGVTSKTYSFTGSTAAVIRGHLIIRSGVSMSCGMSAAITVHGNLETEGGSTIVLQNNDHSNTLFVKNAIAIAGALTKTGTGLPVLACNGNAMQQINITGTVSNNVTLRIDNPAGAELRSPLTLPYQLDLATGKIFTSAANLLTLANGATYTGGSSSSFVEGPLRKLGDDDFIFPIGKGEIYAPAAMENISGMSPSDEVIAEYMRQNPRSTFGVAVEPGQDHVSFVEYWLLQQTGAATRHISLPVTPSGFCRNLGRTYVGRWNGAEWVSHGSTNSGVIMAGPYETGVITSVTPVSDFGAFTLITDLEEQDNPLPLQVLSFYAVKAGDGRARINIQLAGNCHSPGKVWLQRSVNQAPFISIADIPCSQAGAAFTRYDQAVPTGLVRYRLAMADADGRLHYSRIIMLQENVAPVQLLSVSPAVITSGQTTLSITSAVAGTIQLRLTRADGATLCNWRQPLAAGTNHIPVNLHGLPAGLYFLYGTGNNNKTNVLRLLKQ